MLLPKIHLQMIKHRSAYSLPPPSATRSPAPQRAGGYRKEREGKQRACACVGGRAGMSPPRCARALLAISAQLACIARVHAFGFTVLSGKVECFQEGAKASERVSGEWRVQSANAIDIDVKVRAVPCCAFACERCGCARRSAPQAQPR